MSVILAPITGGVRCSYSSTGPTKKKKEKKKKRKRERMGEVGGWGTISSFQFDTLDSKASRVGASTTFMGNGFQSLIVFGRKEEPLYWVLVVSRVS